MKNFFVVAFVVLCVVVSSCNGRKSGRRHSQKEESIVVKTDTVVVIGYRVYSSPSFAEIHFSKEISMYFQNAKDYHYMRYNSPFCVDHLDTCVVSTLSNGSKIFVKNLTKERLNEKHK